MQDSGNSFSRMRLSSCAEARSWPKGFSTMTRQAPEQLDAGDLLHDGFKHGWRDGEVVCGHRRVAELFVDFGEGVGVGVVAIDVTKQAAEFCPGVRVEATVFFEAVLRALFQLIERPAGFCNADHGDVERAALHHRLQGGEDFFVGEIASRAKKHECV